MSALTIRIGTTIIHGTPAGMLGRAEGLFVAPDGFEGWDDGGGDTRSESVARPADHGDFDLPAYIGSRVFSVEGHALAWSERELAQLRSQVMGLGAAGKVRVVIDHQGQTLWADARRSGKPTFKDAGIRAGMHRARFLVQFTAADPRKYGEVREFGLGVTAVQFGNFPASPVLQVGAGSGGYTISGPGGRRIVVTSAPARAHTIDFVNGGLYVGVARQVGAISIWQPWAIPPGSPGVAATISGSRSLTVRVTDTFI